MLDQQRDFINYIRNPEGNNIPDNATKRGMEVYKDAYFGGVHKILGQVTFPRVCDAVGYKWKEIVSDFMIKHDCHSPIATDMGVEFELYINYECELDLTEFPWLNDLVKFELAVHELSKMSNEIAAEKSDYILLSSCIRLFQADYNVHTNDYKVKNAILILGYVDEDDDVCFFEMNSSAWDFLISYRERRLYSESEHKDIIDNLLDRGVMKYG